MSLEVSDVDADAWDREDQPSKRSDQGHEELSEVFIRRFLVGNQSLRVCGYLLDLREIVLLMRPDLTCLGIQFVDDPDAFKHSPLDLKGRELLLDTCESSLYEGLFTCSLGVVNVSAEDQHEALLRRVRGTG